MENNQVTGTEGDIQFAYDEKNELENVYLWKALYSHSYVIAFQCENCDHSFDIDGWFYTFSPIQCPKCNTLYSGIFGQIKDIKEIPNKDRFMDRYFLETFEGEELEIRLPYATRIINGKINHIVLTLFTRQPEKPGKPWGLIDYADNKPELRLFKNGAASENMQRNIPKPKSFFAGLLSS